MTQDFSWIFYNFKADKTRIVSVPEQVHVRNTYKTPRSTNNLSSCCGLTEENMNITLILLYLYSVGKIRRKKDRQDKFKEFK